MTYPCKGCGALMLSDGLYCDDDCRPMWVRQEPSGHETAQAGEYLLTVLDLGGFYGWQLARPTEGSHGHIEGGQIKADRLGARERARELAEQALGDHLEMLAELAALE